VTVKVVESVKSPLAAETVVVPALAAVATPLVPSELLIVATVASLDSQVTWVVRSCVERAV
jgi:hypothetical protein